LWISPDPGKQFASPYAYGPDPVNSVDGDGKQIGPVPFVFGALPTWPITPAEQKYSENYEPFISMNGRQSFFAIKLSLGVVGITINPYSDLYNMCDDKPYAASQEFSFSLGIPKTILSIGGGVSRTYKFEESEMRTLDAGMRD